MDKTNKKLCFFLPTLGDGGLTKVSLTLLHQLSNKGYNIDLIMTSKEQPEQLLTLIPKCVNLIKLSSSRTITSIIPLAQYLQRTQATVLMSGGPSSNCVALLAKIISRSNIKTIITEHSLPSVDVKESGKYNAHILPILMKRLYPSADHIVAVSNAVAKDLSKFINFSIDSIKVIYNPIVNSNLIEKANEKVIHPWLSNKSAPVIIFVGRLVSLKNIPMIIKSIALVNRLIDCKLLLIGEGPEKPHIANLVKKMHIEDKVSFVGYCENPYPYMKASDLLVLASQWEGLPTVMIECMACNTPVVATNNLEGAAEILNIWKNGILTEPNENAIAQAVIDIITRKITFEGIKDDSQKFSSDNSVDQYISLINYSYNLV